MKSLNPWLHAFICADPQPVLQTCEIDMQQLRLKQALDPPSSLEATAVAYLAASKAKFPRRPLGMESSIIPAPRAGAPAAWNPVAELRNMNRKR